MPRSGTTLVEQILASHPMVHGAGELETLSEIALVLRGPDGRTISYPEFVPTLDGSALMGIGARYLAAVNERAPKGERVTDKMPANYYVVGLIHLALPNAKIIHTVRNPVDTCISCFSKLFTKGQNHTYDLGEARPVLQTLRASDGALATHIAAGPNSRCPLRRRGGRSRNAGAAHYFPLRTWVGRSLPLVPRDGSTSTNRERMAGASTDL